MRSRAALRPRVVLVFGESANDQDTMMELVRALRPDVPTLRARRKPLVLMKDRDAAMLRKRATDIAGVVRADAVQNDVRGVVAHQDCDAIEPAHEELGARIEAHLSECGVPGPVAATPAWETETWLFLWPTAVVAAFPSWRRPDQYRRKDVGRLPDAKEAFRRCVRPTKVHRDVYSEADAPRIAAKVRELGLIDQPEARSASFSRFRDRVRAAPWQ